MTSKEKQLKLLEALGLQVDDKVEINCDYECSAPMVAIIRENEDSVYLITTTQAWNITLLMNYDFKKIIEPKKTYTYGEVFCRKNNCNNCPLKRLICRPANSSVSAVLDETYRYSKENDKFPMAYELYEYYKKLLEQKVEE